MAAWMRGFSVWRNLLEAARALMARPGYLFACVLTLGLGLGANLAILTLLNSVLLNLYRDGQDSMSWHSDDEPELGPAPVIASLSLGATRHFRLRRRGQTRTTLSLDLEGGSLLLMEAPLQQHWQHCIPKTRRQTGPRINLTWRQILPHSSSPVSLTRMGQ